MQPTQVPFDYGVPEAPQYQNIPVASDEIYANQLQQDRIKNIIEQISPDNQLYEIEMRIRGYRKSGEDWVPISDKIAPPSELMVARFVSFLGSIMNQNTTMGNLSPMNIGMLMRRVIEYVLDDIDSNAETYGLGKTENFTREDYRGRKFEIERFTPDYTERTRIFNIICNSTFFVLCRCLNGQEARRMWASLQLMESSNSTNNPHSQSPFEALKFWKK